MSSHSIDLTVLASHGESGWTEWSLASTVRKLIEGISGCVLLVPAQSAQSVQAVQAVQAPLDPPRAVGGAIATFDFAAARDD